MSNKQNENTTTKSGIEEERQGLKPAGKSEGSQCKTSDHKHSMNKTSGKECSESNEEDDEEECCEE